MLTDWQRYERLVASLVANQLSTEYCTTPNASILGVISKRKRQIDVLIDARHTTENHNKVIIDAKVKNRKIDVSHVEAFIGLMADVEATHGYLICPKGFTKAAERRAQSTVSLRLLPLDRLENFDPSCWPDCIIKKCTSGKIFWDGYPSIEVKLAPLNGGPLIAQSFIHYTGKCDKCSNFYIKCMTCEDLLHVPINKNIDSHTQCNCKLPWTWCATIEYDNHERRSAELHLLKPFGIRQRETVNRRSL